MGRQIQSVLDVQRRSRSWLSATYLRALHNPSLPATAIARVKDAIDCHAARLHRPAIVILGVAYEDITIDVLNALSDGARAQAEHIANLHARVTAAGMPEGEPAR